MAKHRDNLIWIDLEMTGLVPERDRIIEIATVVTNSQLEIIAEGPSLAIHQEDAILEAMDEWNTSHHAASGLTERVRQSSLTEAEAQDITLAFLREHVEKGKSPMCGNTICQDRRFLYHYMPELERYFHYRHLDVSTIKELVKRWRPDLYKDFSKSSKHLALADIIDSINELKYYRQCFFKIAEKM